MTDVLGNVTDVHKTLSYGSGKVGRYYLRLGLVLFAACGAIVWLQPSDFSRLQWTMAYAGLVLGAGGVLYGLHRWLRPRAMLVLSPRGMQIHVDMVKTFFIPWHEVKGVETADITGTWRNRRVVVTGVTVVLVSRAFYDQHIHINSWLVRGPGWEFVFVPKGDVVQVALHHASLPATAAELREAVEWRWKAFRDAKPADQKPARGPRIFGGFRRIRP
jgi:hypothetical protein